MNKLTFPNAGDLLSAVEIDDALATDPAFLKLISGLEAAVLTSDRQFLRAVVDQEALMERIVARAPQTREAQSLAQVYRKGTFDAWEKTGVLENYAGAHYRYLRPRTIAGRSGILFRLSEENDVLNYHLHEIVKDRSGEYKIADTYIVGLRETLSDALWRGLGHLLADVHPEVAPGRDPESSFAFIESIQSVGALSRALAGERYQEALDLYAGMNAGVKQVRDVKLMHIEAASRLSPLELDEALDDWKESGFAETDLPLKFIDYHTARGRYLSARDSALAVREIVGGEPYLQVRIGELNFAIEGEARAERVRRGGPRAKREANAAR